MYQSYNQYSMTISAQQRDGQLLRSSGGRYETAMQREQDGDAAEWRPRSSTDWMN